MDTCRILLFAFQAKMFTCSCGILSQRKHAAQKYNVWFHGEQEGREHIGMPILCSTSKDAAVKAMLGNIKYHTNNSSYTLSFRFNSDYMYLYGFHRFPWYTYTTNIFNTFPRFPGQLQTLAYTDFIFAWVPNTFIQHYTSTEQFTLTDLTVTNGKCFPHKVKRG